MHAGTKGAAGARYGRTSKVLSSPYPSLPHESDDINRLPVPGAESKFPKSGRSYGAVFGVLAVKRIMMASSCQVGGFFPDDVRIVCYTDDGYRRARIRLRILDDLDSKRSTIYFWLGGSLV